MHRLGEGEDLSQWEGVGSFFGVKCTCRKGDKTPAVILRRGFINKTAQPPCTGCWDVGLGQEVSLKDLELFPGGSIQVKAAIITTPSSSWRGTELNSIARGSTLPRSSSARRKIVWFLSLSFFILSIALLCCPSAPQKPRGKVLGEGTAPSNPAVSISWTVPASGRHRAHRSWFSLVPPPPTNPWRGAGTGAHSRARGSASCIPALAMSWDPTCMYISKENPLGPTPGTNPAVGHDLERGTTGAFSACTHGGQEKPNR